MDNIDELLNESLFLNILNEKYGLFTIKRGDKEKIEKLFDSPSIKNKIAKYTKKGYTLLNSEEQLDKFEKKIMDNIIEELSYTEVTDGNDIDVKLPIINIGGEKSKTTKSINNVGLDIVNGYLCLVLVNDSNAFIKIDLVAFDKYRKIILLPIYKSIFKF